MLMGRRGPRRLRAAVVTWVAALAALIVVSSAAADRPGDTVQSGTIVLRVEGLPSDNGVVRYGLHASKASFDAAIKAGRGGREGSCEILNGVSDCVIDSVPYGTYAILVGHDENRDGQISPFRESSGASNYTERLWWYPSFDKAKFEHRSGRTVVIVRVF